MNAPEKVRQYDRAAQTVGNIVHLEHFNVVIPDQRLAILFYVVGLAGTRDPYLFPGLENMWVNFGRTELGLVYVDFDVPRGTADGIARFYDQVMRAPAKAEKGRATVRVGRDQRLLFTETDAPQPEYDNHHIQIYIADFSTPYEWLKERDLITMETDANEWRFQWITDPRDRKPLFQIEHEVRSMKHHLFARPLVNRNHGITNMTYQPGQDAFRGTY